MFYYKFKDKYLFSKYEYGYVKVNSIPNDCEELYFLYKSPPNYSKMSFAVSCVQDLYFNEDNIEYLKINNENIISDEIPIKIISMINERKIKDVNTEYENYEQCFYMSEVKKKKVNVLALGDVGSTLLIGLKLLGGQSIESIGVFDRSRDKINRWEYEMNQTSLPFDYDYYPCVHGIEKSELFDCDMFVFCASKGVPPVGSESVDVRMVQFEENAKLIKEYAIMASEVGFKGIFAVVSDPVDPLCASVLKESKGSLAPEQIKGYGLGVMNARAMYYAKKDEKFSSYLKEGRAFGPHGNDLIIANSIVEYDDELSKQLTKFAVEANLEVRKTGFKPYVAPALSSGAISIICTLEGKYHYSSNYLGGVFMGSKNRNLPTGLEIEKINMHDELFKRIKFTHENLLNLNKTINKSN